MKRILPIHLGLLLAHLVVPIKSSLSGCPSRESAQQIVRHVNDSILLRCLDNSTCPGMTYVFYHKSSLDNAQFLLVHRGPYKYTHTINSVDDAGEFYCMKECPSNYTRADDSKCYWNVIAMAEIECNLDETVTLNGSTNGSCTAVGNPRPLFKLIFQDTCNYQTESSTIGMYATTVNFRIPHVTEACRDMYCHISNHNNHDVIRRLNITENVIESPANNFDVDEDNSQEINATVVPENTTASTDVQSVNSTTIVEIDDRHYNDDSKSVGSAAGILTMDIYLLCVALGLVLLLLT